MGSRIKPYPIPWYSLVTIAFHFMIFIDYENMVEFQLFMPLFLNPQTTVGVPLFFFCSPVLPVKGKCC